MANTEEIIRVVKEIENIQNHPGYAFDIFYSTEIKTTSRLKRQIERVTGEKIW